MSHGTPCKNGGLTLLDPHGAITFLETSKKSGLWDYLLWYWRQTLIRSYWVYLLSIVTYN